MSDEQPEQTRYCSACNKTSNDCAIFDVSFPGCSRRELCGEDLRIALDNSRKLGKMNQ
jgi:hypothetical protein